MDFIGQDNPVAALELDELIDEMAEALPAHAELYRPGRVQGTRELVIAPNYVPCIASGKPKASSRFCACCMRDGSGRSERGRGLNDAGRSLCCVFGGGRCDPEANAATGTHS